MVRARRSWRGGGLHLRWLRRGFDVRARAEPLAPVMFEVAGTFFGWVAQAWEVNPGNVGAAVMGFVEFAVEEEPAHETIVAEVPGAFDDVAFAEGVADVLARGPID